MFSGAIIPNMQTANGTVSTVQFTFMNGSSSVTIVTLANQSAANTLSFCGDQRSQFPVDTIVKATFTPGMNCDNLISVSWQM
jgi:hypothetical protein